MTRGTFLLVAAAALLAWPLASGSAVAASTLPAGTFGGVGETACVTAAGGFNSNFATVDPSNASTEVSNALTVYTFKKNGTGTIVSANVVNVQDSGGNSLSVKNVPFTYASNGKGGFTLTAKDSTFTGTIPTGGRAGQTFSIDTWTVDAYIAQGSKAIVIATVAPFVENITFSGTNPGPFPRICTREATLMPISPSGGK
jgi:hypothetical protein